jgi:hypothetical protein
MYPDVNAERCQTLVPNSDENSNGKTMSIPDHSRTGQKKNRGIFSTLCVCSLGTFPYCYFSPEYVISYETLQITQENFPC